MAHSRKLIREAVRKRLVDAGIVGSGKVFESRTIAWRPRDLPALAVYTLSETVDQASANSAPRELKKNLSLIIEGAVHGVADIDDAMDHIAEGVERAMHADETFGNLVADTILASTELELYEEGEKYIGVIRLTWSITYYDYAPKDEDAALDDFLRADIRHSLSGDQADADQANDSITLPGAS